MKILQLFKTRLNLFQNFTLSNGDVVGVPMMHRSSHEIVTARFNLTDFLPGDVFQSVAIPYAVKFLSVYFASVSQESSINDITTLGQGFCDDSLKHTKFQKFNFQLFTTFRTVNHNAKLVCQPPIDANEVFRTLSSSPLTLPGLNIPSGIFPF